MFDLVADVEHYPEFVPLCQSLKIRQRTPKPDGTEVVVADMVGPSGSVVGVDRSREALDRARVRAGQRGLSRVQFVEGDLHEPAPGGPFDAIVERLVLMWAPDPAALLRQQATGAQMVENLAVGRPLLEEGGFDRFDVVWSFSRSAGSGYPYVFSQIPEMLIFGDKDTPIPT